MNYRNFKDVNGENILMLAVRANNASQIAKMHPLESFLEEKNNKGETALFIASKLGYEHCVETLINLGANIKTEDKHGWDCLDIAGANRHFNVANILLREMYL